MRNLKTIEKSVKYFKSKLLELPDLPIDPDIRRLERIYTRRIEVLEEYKRELLGE